MQSQSQGRQQCSSSSSTATAVKQFFSKMTSHHQLNAGRLLLFLLLGALLLTLYLGSSCWPAVATLFTSDHRRQVMADLGSGGSEGGGSSSSGRMCFFGSFNSGDGDQSRKHQKHRPTGPARRRGSLLAYPLRHTDQSPTLERLTVERIEALFENYSPKASSGQNCTSLPFWRLHRQEKAEDRLKRLEQGCRRYDFSGRIFTFRSSATNRPSKTEEEESEEDKEEEGQKETSLYQQMTANSSSSSPSPPRSCSTRNCPLLVDEQHQVLACFVQKVASTSLKEIFLRLFSSTKNETNATSLLETISSSNNLTTFHFAANEALLRVSPLHVRHSPQTAYYSALFVRHPFVRLVSAFKDKAERGPLLEPFFYEQYFTPLLRRLHGNESSSSGNDLRPTFSQFVDELLLKVEDPRLYDEHWAPVWSRCEPCFLRYDLVGKLESSAADFAAFKGHLARTDAEERQLVNTTIWANFNSQFSTSKRLSGSGNEEETKCRREHFKYEETVRYLATLRPESITELYRRYYLDFELFGYTFEELFT